MDECLIALEKRMQQLQEALRQALAQHDTFQVRHLDADLTRTRCAWKVLCGLGDVPDAAQLTPALMVAEPYPGEPNRRPDPPGVGLRDCLE
ncbi:hypothetical protein GCM10010260_80630 [Streptomyces filipinensis]|uniref:Uncharacterized protein n=1 Tax=Streptomyces filipinensis TaxID=66887 RepID=A0A918MFD5_9ACTN|nr:hypothetical protein GCM10010260_80630 [Streptomyces filipinensis]